MPVRACQRKCTNQSRNRRWFLKSGGGGVMPVVRCMSAQGKRACSHSMCGGSAATSCSSDLRRVNPTDAVLTPYFKSHVTRHTSPMTPTPHLVAHLPLLLSITNAASFASALHAHALTHSTSPLRTARASGVHPSRDVFATLQPTRARQETRRVLPAAAALCMAHSPSASAV